MKTTIKTTIIILLITLVCNTDAVTQEVENEYQIRTSASFSYKPAKRLKVILSPEIRYDENIKIGRYLVEGKLTYKPVKNLFLTGNYRFIINPRDENPTEYFHRFGAGFIYKRKFGDFRPGIKLTYTNDSDDEDGDNENDNFIRYKAWVDYNIPKCKLTPEVGIELFQQIGSSGIYKVRYKAGFEYKLLKDNYIGVNYKLDYYMKEYTNKHIFSIGYKLKL